MAQAVTHILIPIILIAIFRDFFIKEKKKFPLHYVLIAGIAGILPDIDIIFFWFLNFFGLPIEAVHRTFTHSIFFPIMFLLLFLVLKNDKIPQLGRHKLKINIIFLMIFIGSSMHLLLDFLISGKIIPFYPFNNYSFGLNIVNLLPNSLQGIALPTLDGILLIIWIVYLELKHKISDFI